MYKKMHAVWYLKSLLDFVSLLAYRHLVRLSMHCIIRPRH
jgi:hypothetical protein